MQITKTQLLLTVVFVILLIAGVLYLSDKHDDKILASSAAYEKKCSAANISPSEYYIQHGEYPSCE